MSLELVELNQALLQADDMPWTKPLYSRGQVDLAGDVLSGRKSVVSNMSFDTAFDIVGNWRSSHGYPLDMMYKSLESRARKFNRKALIAQRTKRIPSIQTKLQRYPHMQLSQMQDLGGCRAILRKVRSVERLARYYEATPYDAWIFVKKHNYIEQPKPDGYRGIHLIYKYQGIHQKGAYQGLRIEIQLRSELQHAWATALETIDSFTQQSLKSNIGTDDWKRFFALMGSVVAILEDKPQVPGAELEQGVTTVWDELRELCKRLKVPDVFYGLETGMSVHAREETTKAFYILILDSKDRATRIRGFDSSQEADEEYLSLEKQFQDKPYLQAVLVASSSVKRLREAYPNYYSDMGKFITICHYFRDTVEKDDEKSKENEPPRGDA